MDAGDRIVNAQTVTVRVGDLPEIQAAFEEAAQTIERLRAERVEWEQRYEDLLAQCGGTSSP